MPNFQTVMMNVNEDCMIAQKAVPEYSEKVYNIRKWHYFDRQAGCEVEKEFAINFDELYDQIPMFNKEMEETRNKYREVALKCGVLTNQRNLLQNKLNKVPKLIKWLWRI
ncbi:MAG: hypothetical protein WC940_03145 [Candidatus Paceibacterota bacterium]